jgi:endonuclease III-like uncharacterized protein
MSTDDLVFEYLFIAVLSVNQYTVEKTWRRREELRQHGAFQPTAVASMRTIEIERLLRDAGLDRGPFMTKLFAERLQTVSRFIHDVGIAEARRILNSEDVDQRRQILLGVKGIGPVVIANFEMLRG